MQHVCIALHISVWPCMSLHSYCSDNNKMSLCTLHIKLKQKKSGLQSPKWIAAHMLNCSNLAYRKVWTSPYTGRFACMKFVWPQYYLVIFIKIWKQLHTHYILQAAHIRRSSFKGLRSVRDNFGSYSSNVLLQSISETRDYKDTNGL